VRLACDVIQTYHPLGTGVVGGIPQLEVTLTRAGSSVEGAVITAMHEAGKDDEQRQEDESHRGLFEELLIQPKVSVLTCVSDLKKIRTWYKHVSLTQVLSVWTNPSVVQAA